MMVFGLNGMSHNDVIANRDDYLRIPSGLNKIKNIQMKDKVYCQIKRGSLGERQIYFKNGLFKGNNSEFLRIIGNLSEQ